MTTFEIAAHRIGGRPGPRIFGPWMVDVGAPFTSVDLYGQGDASLALQLILTDWAPVDDEWAACTAELRLWDGSPVGRRPVMIYDRPYDVPTHALFRARYQDADTFSLAIRRV